MVFLFSIHSPKTHNFWWFCSCNQNLNISDCQDMIYHMKHPYNSKIAHIILWPLPFTDNPIISSSNFHKALHLIFSQEVHSSRQWFWNPTWSFSCRRDVQETNEGHHYYHINTNIEENNAIATCRCLCLCILSRAKQFWERCPPSRLDVQSLMSQFQ